MTTQNSISFEILMQKFYSLFDHTSQEGPKVKLININIIQSEYGISIEEIYHIINTLFINIGEQIKNMR